MVIQKSSRLRTVTIDDGSILSVADLPRLSSNRMSFCKVFLGDGTSFAGSSVIFAVDIKPPHGGASRTNLPMCEAHASAKSGRWCNSLGGMVLATSRQGRLGASKG